MDAPSAHQSILSDTTQFGHAAALAGLALAKIAKAFLGGCHQGTILLRSDGRSPLAKGSSLKVADTCPKSRQLRDQRAPRQFGRSQRPSILGRRLRYVTAPAQRLQPVRIARVLARFALQRRNVITLQSSGLDAFDTAPAVALEDGPAYGGPAAGIQVGVVSAQAVFSNRRLYKRLEIKRRGDTSSAQIYLCACPIELSFIRTSKSFRRCCFNVSPARLLLVARNAFHGPMGKANTKSGSSSLVVKMQGLSASRRCLF